MQAAGQDEIACKNRWMSEKREGLRYGFVSK
jgi:hypothetical protein